MDLAQYRRINTIIERDSADATYKYALLRGVIEICQQSSHLREDDGEQVSFPLGLLVEKWLLYYYPIFAAPAFIPQKNGETPDQDAGKVVSFRKRFMPVIDYYRDRGGISVFYNDYARGTMPAEIQPAFGTLARAIRTTITKMPMKHLGYSQSKEHYSVFDYDRSYRLSREGPADRTSLIENSGRFFLSRDLCTIFEHFGGFISGEECLLKKWAGFTASADKNLDHHRGVHALAAHPDPDDRAGYRRCPEHLPVGLCRGTIARLRLVGEAHQLAGGDAHRSRPPVLGLEEQRPLEPPPRPRHRQRP